MSKLSWVKWSFDRWEADMAPHPPEIVGWWSIILAHLHRSETTGELTLSVEGWARIMRTDIGNARGCLDYLQRTKIADVTECNGNVTIINRRMKRHEIEKENTRLRVEKHRCNANVTAQKRLRSKNIEVRSKKEEKEEEKRGAAAPQPPGDEIEKERDSLLARYSSSEQALVRQCFAVLATTRKSGRVAESVLVAQLRRWSTEPKDRVLGGMQTYLDKGYAGDGKGEAYLWGIIRRHQEPKAAPPKPQFKTYLQCTNGDCGQTWNGSMKTCPACGYSVERKTQRR